MKLKEDVSTNATGSAVPGTGDNPATWKSAELMPMQKRKKGTFLNQETFIVSSSTFNSIKHQKKKGMHWKRYLEEDDAYYELREYARKKRKGPIIVEDENTGACMYVRYGDI
jgi:hypothetical protein